MVRPGRTMSPLWRTWGHLVASWEGGTRGSRPPSYVLGVGSMGTAVSIVNPWILQWASIGNLAGSKYNINPLIVHAIAAKETNGVSQGSGNINGYLGYGLHQVTSVSLWNNFSNAYFGSTIPIQNALNPYWSYLCVAYTLSGQISNVQSLYSNIQDQVEALACYWNTGTLQSGCSYGISVWDILVNSGQTPGTLSYVAFNYNDHTPSTSTTNQSTYVPYWTTLVNSWPTVSGLPATTNPWILQWASVGNLAGQKYNINPLILHGIATQLYGGVSMGSSASGGTLGYGVHGISNTTWWDNFSQSAFGTTLPIQNALNPYWSYECCAYILSAQISSVQSLYGTIQDQVKALACYWAGYGDSNGCSFGQAVWNNLATSGTTPSALTYVAFNYNSYTPSTSTTDQSTVVPSWTTLVNSWPIVND